MRSNQANNESFKPSEFSQMVVSQAGIADSEMEQKLLEAFTKIDRKKFVVTGYHNRIDEDVSLPIGYNQVSLKPSTLARMIGLLGVTKGMRVLEVGAGTGYGSAIMLHCGAQVLCIEQQGLMAQQTRKRLDALGYAKILFKAGDGLKGWPEHAPYDAILLNFPAKSPSEDLLSHLSKKNGKLVGAFGDLSSENLWLFESTETLKSYQLEPWQG
ncbi:MAG: protein-L-isoaspartate O-methyltransferase [bacterium]|nr:protein-L-isoaspartate O-methyltransferase [bacterium]